MMKMLRTTFPTTILGIEMPKRNPRKSRKRSVSSKRAPANPWLFGLHAVTAALLNKNRQNKRLLVTSTGHERLPERAIQAFQPEFVGREDLAALLPPGAVHQGVTVLCEPLPSPVLEEILLNTPKQDVIIVLDQVTDPQNIGAVMRSAAAFGARALVMQDRHAPQITGALAKAASGALETLPLVRVTNLARALDELRAAQFWCIGLDGKSGNILSDLKINGRVALVMGAEDDGLRRLTIERCDALARLPTTDIFRTLNVSAAAAAALYECARQQNS